MTRMSRHDSPIRVPDAAAPGVAHPSPDDAAKGFLDRAPDPLRYDGHSADPEEVAGIVSSFIPSGASVLDVGCGTGSVSRLVVEATGARLVGVEPDSRRAAAARLRGLEVVEMELGPELAARLGRLDVVLFADVLEHVADPRALLLAARDVLAPDGVVILSVPNVAHWTVRWDLLRGRFGYREVGILDATHLRWFTRQSLLRFVGRSGMEVLAWRATLGQDLSDYRERWPWQWLSRGARARLLRRLVRRAPDLFACQFVVKARFG